MIVLSKTWRSYIFVDFVLTLEYTTHSDIKLRSYPTNVYGDKTCEKHFFVTLWFNERFDQWQLSNASKNPDLLMTPLWDTRLERDLSKTFILLCPIQSISYCCNLCRVFSSCGEVFSNETTLWVWLTWSFYSTLQPQCGLPGCAAIFFEGAAAKLSNCYFQDSWICNQLRQEKCLPRKAKSQSMATKIYR